MKTILLIEDNSPIRENTAEILELAGYAVITSSGGADGLLLAKRQKPHLIICDIRMPEMTGFEVLEELKKNIITYRIPLIFLSASVEKLDVDIGLELGAHDYLKKPYKKEELLESVARGLRSITARAL